MRPGPTEAQEQPVQPQSQHPLPDTHSEQPQSQAPNVI